MNQKYIEAAKQFINSALKMRNTGEKESRLRENFTFYLAKMFDERTKWVRYHIEGGEQTVRLFRNNKIVNGFIDNCLGSIAIEYEKNLNNPAIFDEGFRQVKEYTASLIRSGVDINLIEGVLSDTLSWHVYQVIPDEGMQKEDYTEENVKLQEIDKLEITDDSDVFAIRLLTFLPRYLGRMNSRFVNAKNLANDFGLNSQYSSKYIDDTFDYIKLCTQKDPMYFEMINQLWSDFVQKVDKDEYITLGLDYALEYYVSTLAKLLCANFISKKSLISDDDELVGIINGTFFENRGFLHFVEYDYFGRLNDSSNVACFLKTVRAIQEDLCVYDFSQKPDEDLFGEIMVQMSARSKRVLLGQELTPSWLSRKLVDHVYEMIPNSERKLLIDMCCGSGSMIIEATSLAMKNLPKDSSASHKAEVLSNSITGIDIDPLAVILAKINWIICVATYKEDNEIEELAIPIYHADSLFLDSPVTEGEIDNQQVLRMKLANKKIDLPRFIISPSFQSLFDAIVDKCYELIHEDKMPKITFETIIRSIVGNREMEDYQLKDVIAFSFHLYESLYELNSEGKNGVWSFLIKNSFRPSLIGGNFTGIVSNTPWLALSKLPDNPYRVALNKMADHYGILPSGSSFLHTELATVFLIHAIDKYLKKGTAFGCILPSTILTGNQHEKFRNGDYERSEGKVDFDIEEIWQIPKYTFNNKAIAVFGRKVPFKRKEEIPCVDIYGDGHKTCHSLKVSQALGQTTWSNDESTAVLYDIYHFLQGADVLPRYLFFFNTVDKGQSYEVSSIDNNSSDAYFLQNMHKGKAYKLPLAKVSKELFQTVVVSNVLLPFHFNDLPLALLPIKRNGDKWEKLKVEDKALYSRSTQNTLSEIDRVYRRYEKPKEIFDALNWRNKLTAQTFGRKGYLVVYGAGGENPCAAFMNLADANKIPIIDQTCYWLVVDTEVEALYLSGLINSHAIGKAISSFQAEGKFGKRHIHTLVSDVLPPFDSESTLHKEFASLVKTLSDRLYRRIEKENYLLLNPNKGTLNSRRKKIQLIFSKLPGYQEYENICSQILEGA